MGKHTRSLFRHVLVWIESMKNGNCPNPENYFFHDIKRNCKLLQEWMWIVTLRVDQLFFPLISQARTKPLHIALWFGHVCSMHRSSPLHRTWNTNVITRFGHVCSMCRSRPLRSSLNTNVITGCLDMCAVCAEAAHCVAVWTRTLYHRFGHVCSMCRSSAWRSGLNTNVITGLDMCAVCAEAVHCVAVWTRTLSQVWTCAQYVPKQAIA